MSKPLDEVSKIRNLWHQKRGDGRLTGMSSEKTCLLVYSLCGVRYIGGTTFIWAVMRNTGSWVTMLRERQKRRTIKADSTEELFSDGLGCSSFEDSVMEVERRNGTICSDALTTILGED